jgi:hypothetical protein
MTNEQSETTKSSESTTGYLGNLGNVIKELKPEEKLIGALLVGILALLIVVIPSVPEDKRVFVWFATIFSVFLLFLIFNYWGKNSASKLSKIKRERDYWERKADDLRKDYSRLATNNNSRLTEIDNQIQQINQGIAQISKRGVMNDQETSKLLQQLTLLAEVIQKQIAHNSSDVSHRIEVGIQIVENAAEIAKRLAGTDN